MNLHNFLDITPIFRNLHSRCQRITIKSEVYLAYLKTVHFSSINILV